MTEDTRSTVCTQEWLDPSAADEVHRVAYALCVAANLRRRRVG